MAQRTNSHPAPCGKVQTRFEPSHLANACLADAYTRLVPVVWRLLPRSPRCPAPGTVAPEIVGRARHEHEEEVRQCL
jgi:hypothetical protein